MRQGFKSGRDACRFFERQAIALEASVSEAYNPLDFGATACGRLIMKGESDG
jgi:hypothetical protein